ncbi:glycerol-3-phosphate phosphatase [Cochliomyia hominivorax]
MPEPINLNQLDTKAVKEWLKSYDTILTDCDAVLWHDNNVIPHVPETIKVLKSLGKNIYFVTNNGTKTRHDLYLKATQMNFPIDEDHIMAPTHSIAEYLKQNLSKDKQVYVIGSPALVQELDDLNIKSFGVGQDLIQGVWVNMLKDIDKELRDEKVGAVVVGFDEHFGFLKILKASHILETYPDCEFIATNADVVHRYPKYCMPGTGALVAAVETCVNRKAKIMGKPNPLLCESLIKNGIIEPKRTLMIGDCAKIDVLFGKNCGFDTLLVGTGNYKWSNVLEFVKSKSVDNIPDYYLESLGDLCKFLV